jgi:hypothetical protein
MTTSLVSSCLISVKSKNRAKDVLKLGTDNEAEMKPDGGAGCGLKRLCERS